MKKIREYVPHKIYANLAKFLEYRELELVSGNIGMGGRRIAKVAKKTPSIWLKEDDFIQTIQLDGYTIVAAKDISSKVRRFHKNVPPAVRELPVKTYIILIEPNSKYSVASAEFMKLLNRIPEFSTTKRKFNMEILVITKILMKSNIHNKIKPYITHGYSDDLSAKVSEDASSASANAFADTYGYTYIHNYPYRVLTSVIPESQHVAKHRIIPTKEEEREILSQIHTEKKHLPKIRMLDAPMIWLGGVTGDLVECMLRSEVTAYEKKYMVVIPT